MPLSQLTDNLFFVLFLHHYNRTVNTENLHSILHFPCFRDSGANCVIKEVNAAFCLPALVVLQHCFQTEAPDLFSQPEHEE